MRCILKYNKFCNCDAFIHNNCFDNWYMIHTECPICRIKIEKNSYFVELTSYIINLNNFYIFYNFIKVIDKILNIIFFINYNIILYIIIIYLIILFILFLSLYPIVIIIKKYN